MLYVVKDNTDMGGSGRIGKKRKEGKVWISIYISKHRTRLESDLDVTWKRNRIMGFNREGQSVSPFCPFPSSSSRWGGIFPI
jgi:hypothetical protein